MDAVSYPNATVQTFINSQLIPLRVKSDDPLASQFGIKWTPSLLTLDSSGTEHHRTVGFLTPEELIPSLILGQAKVCYDLDQYPEAIRHLTTICSEYGASAAAPEAIFLRGVNLYKSTKNAAPLKEAYQTLLTNYPKSEWTQRALPYRLL